MKNNELSNLPCVEKYFYFDEITSSNDVAKALDYFPKEGIFVIHADRQTQGRGQRNNTFFSGEGGLYATVVCPLSEITMHFAVNRSMSLAICEAIEAAAMAAPISIKWPNDILWAGKKVCGILLESLRSSGHIAVGFGINVNTPSAQFPSDIRHSATSMAIETGRRFDIGALLVEICLRFQHYRTVSPATAHGSYRERLYGTGSLIRINDRSGIFETVQEDGRLCLHVENHMEYLTTGSAQFIQ